MYNDKTLNARGMWIGLAWEGDQRGWQWEDKSEVR